MSSGRASRAALAAAAVVCLAAGCDPGAVGVSDCRRIERARCEAAQSCDLGIDGAQDLETCKLYARDNCLHGLEIDESPDGNEVDDCVDAIVRAGECARADGPGSSPDDCSGVTVGAPGPDEEPATVCRVIQDPTLARQCRFLLPDKGSSSGGGSTDGGTREGGGSSDAAPD